MSSDQPLHAIEFQKVCLAFDDNVILDEVSFTVAHGETKIVMGGSGTGKSTILRLVLGLLKADAGRILVDGEDITDYSEKQLTRVRQNIGMVFQDGALFDSLSVYENVGYRLFEKGVPEDEVQDEVRRTVRGNAPQSRYRPCPGWQPQTGALRRADRGPGSSHCAHHRRARHEA